MSESPFDSRGYNPLQVSTSVSGDLWVFRADSGQELRQILEGTAAEADAAIDALNTLKQVGVAKGVFTGDAKKPGGSGGGSGGGRASDSAPPSGGNGGGETCKHGPMKDFADRGYRNRWYCSARNRDEQCPPRK